MVKIHPGIIEHKVTKFQAGTILKSQDMDCQFEMVYNPFSQIQLQICTTGDVPPV